MILEKKAIIRVPTSRGRTPKLLGERVGAHFVPVKKLNIEICLKNAKDSLNKVNTIPIVVSIVIMAKITSDFSMRNSLFRNLFFMFPPNGKKAPKCLVAE